MRVLPLDNNRKRCKSNAFAPADIISISDVFTSSHSIKACMSIWRPPKQLNSASCVRDDGVAAETCIDFEIPHTSSKEILAWFFGGIAFVGFIYEMITLTNPEGSRMAVSTLSISPSAHL